VSAELRTEGIGKAFGGVQALDDCTLTVPKGSITGLIGPNGSGKTTLFNIVTGYERPDTGEVYLDGQRITGASAQRVFRLGLGRTFQLTRIFPRLTLLENMLVAAGGSTAGRRRAHELLEFTGIERYAGALAGTLSYGQRKLLELATVLAAEPALVLLDEPAGGVNPTLIQHLADRIRDLNARGTTFLIVEHNMEFVMGLCSTITVLESGATVVSGPPQIVRTDQRVLDAYLGADIDEEEDLRWRRHPARRVLHRPCRGHHLCGRAQRGGEVDPAGHDQRAAAAAPGPGRPARAAGHRTQPPAAPGHGPGARAAASQPVPGHDRGREPRSRRVHDQRPAAAGSQPGPGQRDVP
jgi:ABC-type branched-subunit amino acid transport system ATPase component